MMRMIVAAWVLMTTVTMTECQGQKCAPAPGFTNLTQSVRRFPTAEACQQAKQQVEQTAGSSMTQLTRPDAASGQASVVRHAMTWSCQPEGR